MLITAKTLRDKLGACRFETRAFRREYPDGLRPTLDNFLHVASRGFDLGHFAFMLLDHLSTDLSEHQKRVLNGINDLGTEGFAPDREFMEWIGKGASCYEPPSKWQVDKATEAAWQLFVLFETTDIELLLEKMR